jgi:hypothetical protein
MNLVRLALALSLFIPVLTQADSARADIRIPGKPYPGRTKQPGEEPKAPPRATTQTASFEVMVATSGGSGVPQLVIPRDAIKDLLADAGTSGSIEGDLLGQAPPATRDDVRGTAKGDTAGSLNDTPEVSRLHSVIAGLAVAMAVALGGVWMVRTRGRTTGRGLALLISASLCLGISVTAWANVPPPFPKKAPPSPVETSTRLETAFTGKVQVRIVSGDGTVQLVLPRSDVAKLAEKGGSRANEPR